MALLPAPIGPNTIRAYQGRVDVYYNRLLETYVARRWPVYHRPSPTDAWKATHENMVEAQAWVKAITPTDRAAFLRATANSAMRWRDVPMKAALSAPTGRLRLALLDTVTATRDAGNLAHLTITLRAPPGYTLPESDHTLRLWYGVLPGLCPSIVWLPTYPHCNPTAGSRRLYASPDPFTGAVLAEYDAETGTVLASVPVDCSWSSICWMLTDRAPGRPTRLLSGAITTRLPPCVIPYRDCSSGEVVATYDEPNQPTARYTWLRPDSTTHRTHRADPIPGQATWPPPCELPQPGGAASCADLTQAAWSCAWPGPALPCWWDYVYTEGLWTASIPYPGALRFDLDGTNGHAEANAMAIAMPEMPPPWQLETTVTVDDTNADPAQVWLAALAWEYGSCGLIWRPDLHETPQAIVTFGGPYGYQEHYAPLTSYTARLVITATAEGVTARISTDDAEVLAVTREPTYANPHARVATQYAWTPTPTAFRAQFGPVIITPNP